MVSTRKLFFGNVLGSPFVSRHMTNTTQSVRLLEKFEQAVFRLQNGQVERVGELTASDPIMLSLTFEGRRIGFAGLTCTDDGTEISLHVSGEADTLPVKQSLVSAALEVAFSRGDSLVFGVIDADNHDVKTIIHNLSGQITDLDDDKNRVEFRRH